MNSVRKAFITMALAVASIGLLFAQDAPQSETTAETGNGLEVFIAPTLPRYGNAIGYSIGVGVQTGLGVFKGNAKSDKSWSDDIVVGLDGNYEYAPGNGFTFTGGFAYLDAGYAFTLLPDSLRLRVTPTIGVGGTYVSWSDSDDSGYNGFAFALLPRLSADMPMPFCKNLRVGLSGGYRMIFANQQLNDPVASLLIGYQF